MAIEGFAVPNVDREDDFAGATLQVPTVGDINEEFAAIRNEFAQVQSGLEKGVTDIRRITQQQRVISNPLNVSTGLAGTASSGLNPGLFFGIAIAAFFLFNGDAL